MKTKKITEQCVKTKLSCKNNKEGKLLTEEDLLNAFQDGYDKAIEQLAKINWYSRGENVTLSKRTPFGFSFCIEKHKSLFCLHIMRFGEIVDEYPFCESFEEARKKTYEYYRSQIKINFGL